MALKAIRMILLVTALLIRPTSATRRLQTYARGAVSSSKNDRFLKHETMHSGKKSAKSCSMLKSMKSCAPTQSPAPSESPAPSQSPSVSSAPSAAPSASPSFQPSISTSPSASPSASPTPAPTLSPTPYPTRLPSASPTPFPTAAPIPQPTPFPTTMQADPAPIPQPTPFPTIEQADSAPILQPTPFPTTEQADSAPILQPTPSPTTKQPTPVPSAASPSLEVDDSNVIGDDQQQCSFRDGDVIEFRFSYSYQPCSGSTNTQQDDGTFSCRDEDTDACLTDDIVRIECTTDLIGEIFLGFVPSGQQFTLDLQDDNMFVGDLTCQIISTETNSLCQEIAFDASGDMDLAIGRRYGSLQLEQCQVTPAPVPTDPSAPIITPTSTPTTAPLATADPTTSLPSSTPSLSIAPTDFPTASSIPTATPGPTNTPFVINVLEGPNGVAIGHLSTCRQDDDVADDPSDEETEEIAVEVSYQYVVYVKEGSDIDTIQQRIEESTNSALTKRLLDCVFENNNRRQRLLQTDELDMTSISSLPQAQVSTTSCPPELLRDGTDCYIIDDGITFTSLQNLPNQTIVETFSSVFDEEFSPSGSLKQAHPDIVDVSFLALTGIGPGNIDGGTDGNSDNDVIGGINEDLTLKGSSDDDSVLVPVLISGAAVGVVLVSLIAYRRRGGSGNKSFDYMHDDGSFDIEDEDRPSFPVFAAPASEGGYSFDNASLWQYSMKSTDSYGNNNQGVEIQRTQTGVHHCLSDTCTICRQDHLGPTFESTQAAIEVVRSLTPNRSLSSSRSYGAPDTVIL